MDSKIQVVDSMIGGFCEFALTIQYARGHSAIKKSNIH